MGQRFTETEVAISKELKLLRIPYFMVRSKVDLDVTNNLNDLGVPPEETLKIIYEDMRRLGVEHPYLVSSRQREKYDMKSLLHDSLFTVIRNRGMRLTELGIPEPQQPVPLLKDDPGEE